MSDVVLDASALLALMNEEPGGEHVAPMIPRAVMSAANMAEVVGKLADKGLPEASIRAVLGVLRVRVMYLDAEQAFEVGLLRHRLAGSGLSLADLCCLSLAIRLNAPAVTADRAWAGVEAGAEIVEIR